LYTASKPSKRSNASSGLILLTITKTKENSQRLIIKVKNDGDTHGQSDNSAFAYLQAKKNHHWSTLEELTVFLSNSKVFANILRDCYICGRRKY
jgi:hypothetical protein